MIYALTLFFLTYSLVSAGSYECPTPLPHFDCPAVNVTIPEATEVTKLRFGNIKVVMAMGDSMTAAFGAEALPVEYRGISYSTGGDQNATTIAKYLQHYNPDLDGMGYKTSIPLTPYCSGLNCAVSGAVVEDLPSQLEHLTNHLKSKTYEKYQDEWKLLTIFIGANNACGCKSESNSADNFEKNLRTALTYTHGNLTKTFVSVMTLFNISGVWDLAQTAKYCETVVPVLHECSCLESNATDRLHMDELAIEYNKRTFKVAEEFYKLNDPNFTVVVQPAVDSFRIGDYSQNFLSDVDCFHPSLCAHQGFAYALWNNMNSAPIDKAHTLNYDQPEPLKCPTQDSFLQ